QKKSMVEEIVLRCAMAREFLYRPQVAVQLLQRFGSAACVMESQGDEDNAFVVESLSRAFSSNSLKWAEEEVEWCAKKGIRLLFCGEQEYPPLLAECDDAPFMLYYKGSAGYKGNAGLCNPRCVSMVGTRLASVYGREACSIVVGDIAKFSPLVVSGLAYGIDIASHRAALENGLETVAVLPNGLDMIYPARHRDDAVRIVGQGGLLTEFPRGVKPQRVNFVKRNRIIAAISRALVVVESRVKGGSMITAEFACNYNRDIFAVPGRVSDPNSFGCNYLIAKNVAAIYNSASAIPSALGWEAAAVPDPALQPKLFSFDIENKEKILLTLKFDKPTGIERICAATGLEWGAVASMLLELELEGRIKAVGNTDYCLRR
ncbi:MAG: DNA-processing protein DprA, partial [Bacteroidales bacterium]|nr:DNA-processing protein DprA [Bacteroidales bacterium]